VNEAEAEADFVALRTQPRKAESTAAYFNGNFPSVSPLRQPSSSFLLTCRCGIVPKKVMAALADAPMEPLLFQPDPSKYELLDSLHNIPRYLFRLHGPYTAGTTTLNEVTSPLWTREYPSQQRSKEDLFQKSTGEASRLLDAHLRWKAPHEMTCNLMSWTSSLLFALQYGLYKSRPRNGYPGCDFETLFLLVVDTQDFPAGAFVRDRELLNAFVTDEERLGKIGLGKVLEWRTRIPQPLYFGEYLSQGSLDVRGRCVQTSLKALIENGLFDLVPALRDPSGWNYWANRVVELRIPFEAKRPSPATLETDVQKALLLAERSFGPAWTLPMALMLLSLSPRPLGDPIIVDGVLAEFTSKSDAFHQVSSPCDMS
jgi:hypothetical protein